MKQFILKNKTALTGLAVVLLIGGVTMSFQEDSGIMNQKFTQQNYSTDTIPDRTNDGHMKMSDFDKIDAQLGSALTEVGKELKNINFDDIEKTVNSALKEVDLEKIMKDVENSLKDIDVEKIVADVSSSLKDVNWDDNDAEVKKALKEAKVEMEKAKVEMKKVNKEEIKKELEKAKIDIEKSKAEIKNLDMDKIMNEAKKGINKGREEMKKLKLMFTEMEKDGLINIKDGFSVEYKDKDLFINGKKQSDDVTGKYRSYFHDDHFKITIDKE